MFVSCVTYSNSTQRKKWKGRGVAVFTTYKHKLPRPSLLLRDWVFVPLVLQLHSILDRPLCCCSFISTGSVLTRKESVSLLQKIGQCFYMSTRIIEITLHCRGYQRKTVETQFVCCRQNAD